MASTFTTLGIELMATGENAGTWGTKTNTNLGMVQSAVAGYVEKSIAGGAQTTALTITDGDNTESTSVARQMVIKLTGSITGNQIVTVPNSLEKLYVVVNGTSGSFTVQFKTASGSGITFATTDKGTKFFFSDGTNINEIISSSVPADNISTGDAASSFATSSGAVLIDSQASTATVDGHTGVTIQTTNSGDITLDSVADIVLDADGADIFLKDAGTTYGSLTNSSGNLIIKSGTTTALTFSGANATLAGDLTISGDDLTMGTNTSGAALIGDGTNYNPVVISGDISIASSGVAAIGSGVIVNADVNASAAIAVSKTALTAGTGISLSTNTLNVDAAQTGITSLLATDIKIGEDDQTKIDFETADEIHFYAANVEQVYVADNIFGPQSDSDVDLGTTGVRWKDAFIDTITTTGNVTVGGDLTITGDDLTMGTNTSGHALVADGTNFNPVAISGDITLAANGAVAIASGVIVNADVNASAAIVDTKLATISTANKVALTALDIDGGTEIGEAIVDADILIIDNGAGGTNKKVLASRFKTYVAGGEVAADDITVGDAAVSIATTSGNVVVDSNAGAVSIDGHTGVTVASSSSGDITLDSVADIVLDAAGNDFSFKASGTEILKITNSSSDVIIKPIVDAKDIIFQQRDGTEVARIEDNATFNVVTGKLAINGTAVTSTAAELNLVDGITAGTVSASLAVIVDSDSDISGFRNVTLTGELDAATGDFSGVVDIAGQLTVADGSAGAPSISNTGDANTGLLFSAADTLAFSAGGTSQFTMADGLIAPVTDNDVDLGTNSLQFKNVHVNGTTFTDALGFGTVVMTLPTADGNADQILVTDGSGALSFADNSGGTSWQGVKTGNYTASAGEGIFANTTSASFTVTLPSSPSIGDEVSIKDYAGTFDSNALTIGRNSQPIEGVAADLTVSVERAGLTLAYSDSTQGWLLKDK